MQPFPLHRNQPMEAHKMAHALKYAAQRLLLYWIFSLLMLCAVGAVASAATALIP